MKTHVVRVMDRVRVRVRVRVEGWGAHEDHRVLVGDGHVVAQHVLVDEAGRVLPAGALGHAVHRVPYVDALIGGDRVELLVRVGVRVRVGVGARVRVRVGVRVIGWGLV